MLETASAMSSAPADMPTRTCVGCGARASAETLLRFEVRSGLLVWAPGRTSRSRAAYAHARNACLQRGFRGGFARSMRAQVQSDVAKLAAGADAVVLESSRIYARHPSDRSLRALQFSNAVREQFLSTAGRRGETEVS